MKVKFFALFLFVTLGVLPAIAQTPKSSKSNSASLPSKTKLRPGLSLDNRPPSSTMRSATEQTPTPAPVAGYQIKEGVSEQSYSSEKTALIFASIFIFLGLVVVAIIYVVTHPQQSKRARVRSHKNQRFRSHARDGSVMFDHESDFH